MPSGESASSDSVACTKPQLASATAENFLSPALRVAFSRSQPMGDAEQRQGQRDEMCDDLELVQKPVLRETHACTRQSTNSHHAAMRRKASADNGDGTAARAFFLSASGVEMFTVGAPAVGTVGGRRIWRHADDRRVRCGIDGR